MEGQEGVTLSERAKAYLFSIYVRPTAVVIMHAVCRTAHPFCNGFISHKVGALVPATLNSLHKHGFMSVITDSACNKQFLPSKPATCTGRRSRGAAGAA